MGSSSAYEKDSIRGQGSGASAQCRDLSYSFSTRHQGTRSHHGGVSRWFN